MTDENYADGEATPADDVYTVVHADGTVERVAYRIGENVTLSEVTTNE